MKLLFIGAHPADLVDLAGGTIANHISTGDEVHTVAATLGIYSHPAEVGRLGKIQECTAALIALWVDNYNFYEMEDGPYLRGGNQALRFISLLGVTIGRIQPDVVITHHPTEAHHPDHSLIGQWTLDAVVAAGRHVPDSTYRKFDVSNVFFYGYQHHPHSNKLGFNTMPPDVIVDITGSIETKAVAFMELKSQYNTEEIVWARLNSMERELGRQYGFQYAEGFISLKPCRTQLLPDFGDTSFYKLLKEQANGQS